MNGQPPPPCTTSPVTSARWIGAPSSSWTTVSRVTSPSICSISQVIRVSGSAAWLSSNSIRQLCTSRRGGSTSSTSPSTTTSGVPIAFIPSLASARNVPPGFSSYSEAVR